MWMCPQANAGMRKADIVSRKLYFALNVHSFMVHFVPKKGKKWMQATRHFGEKGRLEAKVSSLRLIGKKKYVMEDLKSFKFPCTSAQLKSGELETMINGLTLIEEMVNSLETNFNNGQTEKESSMDRILKETKKEKKVTMKEWLTEVTWDANDEESDDEESQEDNDEESERNSDNQEIHEEITYIDSDKD